MPPAGLFFAANAAGGEKSARRSARVRAAAPPPRPPFKAMLLSCFDPRIQAPIASWMSRPVPGSHATSLRGQYSQFTIAGGAVGVTASFFPEAWRQTFWDNFATTIKLHGIKNLVAVNHSNCGSGGIAFGEDVPNNPERELPIHVESVTKLRETLLLRHPDIGFQAWYLARDPAGRFTEWTNLIPGPVIA
jgi:hypothetical protein